MYMYYLSRAIFTNTQIPQQNKITGLIIIKHTCKMQHVDIDGSYQFETHICK
jgi:hypothetical protein